MNKRDIIALAENRLSEKRKQEVIKWLLKNPERQEQYHKIKAKHVAKLLRESQKATKNSRFTLSIFQYIGYAAVLTILFSLAFLYKPTKDSIKIEQPSLLMSTTSVGENKTIELSDGTVIMLNSNTSISYPSIFSTNNREVVLQGEAFFDVTHDANRPFIVKTDGGMKIHVLGTSFNVKSYPEDSHMETTLVSGKVRVVEEKDNKTVFLNPSQRATYIKKEDKIIIDKVDTEVFTAWREGKLVYDETPIREVISDLKRKYHISIAVASPTIMNYKYTGTFDNLTIEEILDLFEVSSPINYKLTQNKITLHMTE
ncbi:FecR family protein [Zobellia sp. 1_MG-2023]|uniref:FecR family protein n=1 Tax=Zobellia sp. 1_MG-2023 TaxID=3062626 RepID=UPI0026E2990B|nr:FecR domain-containing protein [Zobellia sp. 1_MG-2023]MDO6819834.1 FecR domain-containing protein [Zobellia sp. 1_MG-2023]